MKPKHILIGMLLIQTGCSHHAYKPQRIDIERHTLVLHETRVQMENAYEIVYVNYPNHIEKIGRGDYTGFINLRNNELHCYGVWPEQCMLHEYKHLGSKYGLIIPDDPHFERR